MAQVAIRNLDDADIEILKVRASLNKHSLEQELRLIIHQEAKRSRTDFLTRATQLRKDLAHKPQSDSTELLREDRNR